VSGPTGLISVPERVLLFCLASDTDWAKAGVPPITVQHLLVRNLVERKDATQLALTVQGRSVLAALSFAAMLFLVGAVIWPR
jgi:hypothetical protein